MRRKSLIDIKIKDLLRDQKRSLYWLSKESGVGYKTLTRLKNGEVVGINFLAIEKICKTLACQISDILVMDKHHTRK